jgi:hypothetical protein
MSALTTVVVGAAPAGLFTLAGVFGGAIYGGKREHSQWLRNSRMRAYEAFIAAIQEGTMVKARLMSEGVTTDLLATWITQMASAHASVLLTGPVRVAEIATRWMDSMQAWFYDVDTTERPPLDAMSAFLEATRSTLRA